jgi:DMSO/TMAO reductase YedYZ heme-binding membrane subunit
MKRWLTSLMLALSTAAACYLVYWLRPKVRLYRILCAGTGDAALLFLVITLVIGPIRLLWRRHNRVSMYLRRDVGVWCGLTGIAHVIFAVASEEGRVRGFFLRPGSFLPLTTVLGVLDYLGLGATLISVVLCSISSDVALRWLGARPWKLLQRANYILFILAAGHALGYQLAWRRDTIVLLLFGGLFILVLAMQGVGFFTHRQAEHRPSAH